jgi:hypothetical protein
MYLRPLQGCSRNTRFVKAPLGKQPHRDCHTMVSCFGCGVLAGWTNFATLACTNVGSGKSFQKAWREVDGWLFLARVGGHSRRLAAMSAAVALTSKGPPAFRRGLAQSEIRTISPPMPAEWTPRIVTDGPASGSSNRNRSDICCVHKSATLDMWGCIIYWD